MRWVLGVVAGIMLAISGAGAAETSTYNDAMGARVQHLVDARDFAGLEAMAADFRTKKSRSDSGTEDLASFYKWSRTSLGKLDDCTHCAGQSDAFIADWLHAHPRDATANIVFVRSLLDRAFAIRGHGYADTVPDEAMPAIHALDERAYRHLLAVKPFVAVDPFWYVEMITTALLSGRSTDPTDQVFREGRTRFPGFLPIYRAMANHLLPQWFGSWEQIDAMAKAAVVAKSADGIGIYARIYRAMAEDYIAADKLRSETAIDWPLMVRSMRSFSAQYPATWNYDSFAHLSCAADDFVDAQYYFEKSRISIGGVGTVSCGVKPGAFKPA